MGDTGQEENSGDTRFTNMHVQVPCAPSRTALNGADLPRNEWNERPISARAAHLCCLTEKNLRSSRPSREHLVAPFPKISVLQISRSNRTLPGSRPACQGVLLDKSRVCSLADDTATDITSTMNSARAPCFQLAPTALMAPPRAPDAKRPARRSASPAPPRRRRVAVHPAPRRFQTHPSMPELFTETAPAKTHPRRQRRERRRAPVTPPPFHEGLLDADAAAEVVARAFGNVANPPAAAGLAAAVQNRAGTRLRPVRHASQRTETSDSEDETTRFAAAPLAEVSDKVEKIAALQAERRALWRLRRNETYACNLELKDLARRRDLQGCLNILEDMSVRGVRADAYSYSTVLSCCARNGGIEVALKLYARMEADRIRVDEHVLVVLVGIAGRAEPPQLDFARALFHRSRQPSLVLCNSFLDALARSALVKDVESLLAYMVASGVGSDAYSASAVAKAYATAGRGADGAARLAVLRDEGVPVPPQAHCMIVRALAHEGRVKDARAVFERMPERTQVAYNVMIAAYEHSEQPDVAAAFDLFEDMLQIGVAPDRYTLHALMKVCLAAHAGAMALQVYGALKESRFSPNVVSYRLALQAAAVERDALAVSDIVYDVGANGGKLREDGAAMLVAACVRCDDVQDALVHVQEYLERTGVASADSFFTLVEESLEKIGEGSDAGRRVVRDLRESWRITCASVV